MHYKILTLVIVSSMAVGCSSEDPSALPNSSASYEELNNEIGCHSKYSDDKKHDIFKSRYENHWMTWRGSVDLAEADEASLNIDGKGTQDLNIDFSNKMAGYNLTKGEFITVRFVMKSEGGCILPFGGEHATIQ